MDIWPMLTSVKANIRVPYYGLGPIPFLFNWIPIPIPFFFNFNSNSATHDDFQIEFQFPRFNLNVSFEDFNSNLNLNISQLMSSSKLSMAIITWYIELLISLYHVSVLFPFLKDCNFVVLCLIKYHDLLEQHQCWFLSTGLSRNLNWD